MKAYCVKCKAETDMADAVESVLKNGRKAIKGKCPKCGTGMFKMMTKTEAAPTTALKRKKSGPLRVRV